ncbi:hypothetical protein ACFLTH_07420 [Bacteroidota bacterium]
MKMETDQELKKKHVLEAAKKWWASQKDPKGAPMGSYVCDACGGPITEKEGTSLLGSYMRCVNCTGRMFNNWDVQQLPEMKRRDDEKEISSPAAEKAEFKIEKCFHCGKNPADEKSKHIITLVKKSTWESGRGKITRIILPRCDSCKHYIEWGDRTFIVLLPIVTGIILSALITAKLWLIPILIILFYLPFVYINIKLMDLFIPKWKNSKAGNIEEHPEIKPLLDEAWKIRRTFKENIFAIW